MSFRPPECAEFGHERFATIRESLGADIQRYLTKSPENIAAGDSFVHRAGAFLTPQLLSLLLYRISHWIAANGWMRTARLVSRVNLLVHGLSIPPSSCIGPGCLLPHPVGVTFCGTAGRRLTVYSMAICCPLEPFADFLPGRSPRLGDGVTIGGHAVVAGAVSIGDGCRVGFCASVDHDVPAGALVVSRAHRMRLERPDVP